MSLNISQFGAMLRRAKALRLDDPDCAYGQCKTASSDFQRLHGGEQVEYWHPLDLSDAHTEWQNSADEDDQNLRYMGHTVNKVNDHIVDWTASQFWGNVGTPLVEPVEVYNNRFMVGPKTPEWTKEYKHGDYFRTRRELRPYE